MATSRLNSPGRGKGRRASNPEMGSRVPRRSGRGRRPSAPTEENRASHSGLLAQEARLAFGLGWFGIGLGLAELLVPRRFARTIGVPYEHHRLIRAMGVREIANGLGLEFPLVRLTFSLSSRSHSLRFIPNGAQFGRAHGAAT